MIVLYYGSGARDFNVYEPAMSPGGWNRLKSSTIRLLQKRGEQDAANILKNFPFEILRGDNYFGDEFSVLYFEASLNDYVEIEGYNTKKYAPSLHALAQTITEIGPYIRFIAVELQTDSGAEPVARPSPTITSNLIERALQDAEALLVSQGAISAVDRAHTAIHAYVKAICHRDGIILTDGLSLTQAFSHLKKQHPAFNSVGPHSEQVVKVLRALGAILDSVNFLRNRGSIAHPNDELLKEPEAMLAINCVRTLLHYLDSKLENT